MNSNLIKLANANYSKQLWAAVKSSVNSGSSSRSLGHPLLNDVHAVNDFCQHLFFLEVKGPQVNFSPSHCTEVFITDYELEPRLCKIKPTAPALDALPSWIFSKCSYKLAGIVAYIFNSSFCAGVVPEHWKRSVIRLYLSQNYPSLSVWQTFVLSLLPRFCLGLLRNGLYRNGSFLLLITKLLTISLHLGLLVVLRVPWYFYASCY